MIDNILFVATTPYAGFGPYVSEIINNLSNINNIYFLLREDGSDFFEKNLIPEIKSKSIIVKYKNSNFNKLSSLFYPNRKFINKLHLICKEKKINKIHFVTDDCSFYRQIIALQEQYKVYYTVHDLYPHEMKKKFYKKIRAKINRSQRKKIIERVQNLVTNSKDQFNELKTLYPTKNIFFHEFPTLVNKAIKSGERIPTELENRKDYILFFGRIEKYKGIHLLYNVYINSPEIQQKYILVIAGSGDIYFERDLSKEENIIFINRYIHDNEVRLLYENAHCTIYPYISATQSGVLSLSAFFNIPIIASDVPFFKNLISDYNIGITFQKNNTNELKQAIIQLDKLDIEQIQENQHIFYDKVYDISILRKQILEIYNE